MKFFSIFVFIFRQSKTFIEENETFTCCQLSVIYLIF